MLLKEGHMAAVDVRCPKCESLEVVRYWKAAQ
ncbi:MAG: hypothetical protein HQL74_15690 [Magnetococcales bacterium]|nr:hypothetical protein [Magnetococcales bacterium]